MSDPLKLAAFLLYRQDGGGWTPEMISDSINEKKRVTIMIPELLLVYLTYQTSWVDKNGQICFNNDIYERDKKLIKALFNE